MSNQFRQLPAAYLTLEEFLEELLLASHTETLLPLTLTHAYSHLLIHSEAQENAQK